MIDQPHIPQTSQQPNPKREASLKQAAKLKSINNDDYIGSSDLALSSLQCPSPPPILNTTINTGNNVSSVSINEIINSDFHKKPHLDQISTTIDEQIEQSASQQQQQHISYANLQHPSPTSTHASLFMPSNASVQSIQSANGNKPVKDTIPAGGALLRGRVAVANTAIVAVQAAATAREKLQPQNPLSLNTDLRSGNVSSTSLSSSDPQSASSSSNLKSPDMHAHFYVEDTIRHGGVRSRSNSASTGEPRMSKETSSVNIAETPFGFSARSNSLKSGSASPINGPPSSNTINNNSSAPVVGNNNVPGPNITLKKDQLSTLDPRLPLDDGKIHVLFGVCGSVGCSKIKAIIKKLEDIYGRDKISIQIVLTSAAEHLVSRTDFSPSVTIWRDKDEWTTWKVRTDPVLHIELRRWADVLIVAPLTANTLSKIAIGICDNLLTNVIRAWNTQYPILLAPSMVSFAYNSVITKRHLATIKEEMPWIEVLKPMEKVIGSYGDIGMGGMMDYNEIVNKIVNKLGGYPDEEEEDGDEGEGEGDEEEGEEEGDDDDDDEDDDYDEDEEDDGDAIDDDDDNELNSMKQDKTEKTPVKALRKLTVAEEDELINA
ncbi:hypothetical protein WICPIJ_002375 [Wickerhamomyces pijperi]|uniref:Flavoprotein domain-containing protein n=1 Tax=Wickerhamomyces pijperi TaxID=599730 RepID=A0A9P8QBJ6_WICPI|nr:hypothetical protein WICPIJ_002375 [Wickerhamomyces pijperi]